MFNAESLDVDNLDVSNSQIPLKCFTLNLRNSQFTNNKGRYGSVIFFSKGSAPNTATITNTNFINNFANVGPVMYFNSKLMPTITTTGVVFTNNVDLCRNKNPYASAPVLLEEIFLLPIQPLADPLRVEVGLKDLWDQVACFVAEPSATLELNFQQYKSFFSAGSAIFSGLVFFLQELNF
jgi:hypothetical protein